MTITAKITISGETTHERNDFKDMDAARRWASVQGLEGFDFVALGASRVSFVDTDRNAVLSLSK